MAQTMFEQNETASGYVFYVNKQTGEQQNDNPQLLEIMQVIREKHKSIRYVIYRCATKIWFLKQSFYTVNIPYSLVTSVLNHHGFTQCDNVPVLKPSHLTALIHDIYFAAMKCDLFKQSVDFNLSRCTAMLANFFWNVYDPNRMVSLSLLEFKQLMLILCNTQHFNKLAVEEFNLAADHNRCVNRFRFESIIKVISKFFFYIEESKFYRSQSISEMMIECFEQCPGMIGLVESQFVGLWQKQHIGFSQYSNVLALVYRIKESQSVVHEVECVNCKQTPIVGIRFKCQQCRKLSLCFECFCTGYKSSKHEITHAMYEISTNITKNNVISSTISCLGKWFCCTKKTEHNESKNNLTMETKVMDENEAITQTTVIECINDTKWSSMRNLKQNNEQTDAVQGHAQTHTDQLNLVIQSLLHQTEEFQKYLALSKKNRKHQKSDFLNEHQTFLDAITKQLSSINVPKSILSSTSTFLPQSSTPYRNVYNRKPLTFSIGSQLANSIYGAESTVDKSYFEDNRSDWTLADISTLLQSKVQSMNTADYPKTNRTSHGVIEDQAKSGGFEAEMQNFKEILNKIRDIMDDSYSDNTELSTATKNLEDALDSIIRIEEQKRTKS